MLTLEAEQIAELSRKIFSPGDQARIGTFGRLREALKIAAQCLGFLEEKNGLGFLPNLIEDTSSAKVGDLIIGVDRCGRSEALKRFTGSSLLRKGLITLSLPLKVDLERCLRAQ